MRLLKRRCPDSIGDGGLPDVGRNVGRPVGLGAALKVPQDWGIRGLIETISAISLYKIWEMV
jgi:hypothetical protein